MDREQRRRQRLKRQKECGHQNQPIGRQRKNWYERGRRANGQRERRGGEDGGGRSGGRWTGSSASDHARAISGGTLRGSRVRRGHEERGGGFGGDSSDGGVGAAAKTSGLGHDDSRWLVFENSFSPAVDSPRRPIKKSHTPTGTHTAICGKSVRFGRRSKKWQGTQRAFPHARYIGACEKKRERRRGSSRGSRTLLQECLSAPTTPASLRAKCAQAHPAAPFPPRSRG